MLFKDDIFVALIRENNFYKACKKHVVPPVGKLPFENGFELLYEELVANKVSIKSIEYSVLREADTDLVTKIGIGSYFFIIWPYLVPLVVASPFVIIEEKKREKFQNKFDKLSIGTSKETVIELLGQPKLSRKSTESDYEILFYRYEKVIGLRGGKIEWIFNCGLLFFRDAIVYGQSLHLSIYEQLLKSVEFQDPKTRGIIEENIEDSKKMLEVNE